MTFFSGTNPLDFGDTQFFVTRTLDFGCRRLGRRSPGYLLGGPDGRPVGNFEEDLFPDSLPPTEYPLDFLT